MRKKLTACMMAAAMTVGCMAGTPVYADSEEFSIGMRFPVTLDQMQQQTMENMTELVESAGGKLLVEMRH